jgi:hypothetical protein
MNPNPHRNRNRWLLRLAILPLIAIFLLLYANKDQADPLTVLNRSGQPIARLKVTVAGKTSELNALPAGAAKTMPLTINSPDEPFQVEGELANGTLIRGSGKVLEGASQLIIDPRGEFKFQQPGKN